MAAKSGNDDDHNYELENEVLRRRIQTLDKLIGKFAFYIREYIQARVCRFFNAKGSRSFHLTLQMTK